MYIHFMYHYLCPCITIYICITIFFCLSVFQSCCSLPETAKTMRSYLELIHIYLHVYLHIYLEIVSLLDVLRRNPKNELERRKKLEIAVPRPPAVE